MESVNGDSVPVMFYKSTRRKAGNGVWFRWTRCWSTEKRKQQKQLFRNFQIFRFEVDICFFTCTVLTWWPFPFFLTLPRTAFSARMDPELAAAAHLRFTLLLFKKESQRLSKVKGDVNFTFFIQLKMRRAGIIRVVGEVVGRPLKYGIVPYRTIERCVSSVRDGVYVVFPTCGERAIIPSPSSIKILWD